MVSKAMSDRMDWFEGELAKADEWKAHNRALQQRVEELEQSLEHYALTSDTVLDRALAAEARERVLREALVMARRVLLLDRQPNNRVILHIDVALGDEHEA